MQEGPIRLPEGVLPPERPAPLVLVAGKEGVYPPDAGQVVQAVIRAATARHRTVLRRIAGTAATHSTAAGMSDAVVPQLLAFSVPAEPAVSQRRLAVLSVLTFETAWAVVSLVAMKR